MGVVKKKKRKSNRGYKKRRKVMTFLEKLVIAKYVINNPHLQVKAVAIDLNESEVMVYAVIKELLDVKKEYSLKDAFKTKEVHTLMEIVLANPEPTSGKTEAS